jgi:hypothetical protein
VVKALIAAGADLSVVTEVRVRSMFRFDMQTKAADFLPRAGRVHGTHVGMHRKPPGRGDSADCCWG